MEVVMPNPTSAEALDREFLGIRSRLIELAATLDRIDRSGGPLADDPRRSRIRRALEILMSDAPDRAERAQIEFSLPYDEKWDSIIGD